MKQTSQAHKSQPSDSTPEKLEGDNTNVPFSPVALEFCDSDLPEPAVQYRISCLLQLPEKADIPDGTIPLNRSYRRVDPRVPPPPADCLRRLQAQCVTNAPCFDAHLNGACEHEHCDLDHDPLEEDLKETLEWVARSIPCGEGSLCSKLTCFLGHICQDTDCERLGGGTECLLDLSLHFGGLSAHHFVPPAIVDAHRDEYLWTSPIPLGKSDISRNPPVPGSFFARQTKIKKPNLGLSFKFHMRIRSLSPRSRRRRRDRSRAGSASSHASSRSKASQVSWDDDDEFDQVLKAMDSDLEIYVARLEEAMPSVAARILGGRVRARQRAEYDDLKKELQLFRKNLAGYFGMSDKERRMELGSFSAEYRSLRGRFPVSSHTYRVRAVAHGLSYRRVLFTATRLPSNSRFGSRGSD